MMVIVYGTNGRGFESYSSHQMKTILDEYLELKQPERFFYGVSVKELFDVVSSEDYIGNTIYVAKNPFVNNRWVAYFERGNIVNGKTWRFNVVFPLLVDEYRRLLGYSGKHIHVEEFISLIKDNFIRPFSI